MRDDGRQVNDGTWTVKNWADSGQYCPQ